MTINIFNSPKPFAFIQFFTIFFNLFLVLFLAPFSTHANSSSEINIKAVGDMMLGLNAPSKYPDHFFLEEVSDILSNSDISFGNQEGSICDLETLSPKCNSSNKECHAFKSPSHLILQYKKAGFDVLSLANNHIFDYGSACASETKNKIENNNILAIGLTDKIRKYSKDEKNLLSSVRFINKNNQVIAFIGFHFSNSGQRLLSIHETQLAQNIIQFLKQKSDIVIVSMHAGSEGHLARHTLNSNEFFKGENRGNSIKFAHTVIDAGADLVLGHGPHVLRGLEIYKDRLIAYSLGNFATYSGFSLIYPKNLGAILDITLSHTGAFKRGQIFSTIQKKDAQGKTRLKLDLSHQALKEIYLLSNEDFSQSSPQIYNDGSVRPIANSQ